jgi:hypothetical protein
MSQKVLLASSVLAGLFSTQLWSAEMKFDNRACYVAQTNLIRHADGFLSGSFDSILVIEGPEGDPFYLMSAHCVGTFTVVGGKPQENGSCEFANTAGDKFFLLFARDGDPLKVDGALHFVHGTGKFEGMSGEGKYRDFAVFASPSVPNKTNGCNRGWGTYTVK